MKIYIINMKRSPDRREKMTRQMERLGLDYEFFTAVDGNAMTQEEVDKYIDHNREYFRELKRGEIGCFLSHYSLYKKIAESDAKGGIIMEDDIVISKNFPAIVKELEQMLQPEDAYMFYSILLQPVEFTADKKLNNGYNLCNVDNIRSLFGMQGYMLGKQAAKNLADNLLPFNNVVDDWMWYTDHQYIKKLQIVFPFPIERTPDFSDIHDQDVRGTRFGWFKTMIRKYKLFPFWHIMMNVRKKRLEEHGIDLIKFNGKGVDVKFR